MKLIEALTLVSLFVVNIACSKLSQNKTIMCCLYCCFIISGQRSAIYHVYIYWFACNARCSVKFDLPTRSKKISSHVIWRDYLFGIDTVCPAIKGIFNARPDIGFILHTAEMI